MGSFLRKRVGADFCSAAVSAACAVRPEPPCSMPPFKSCLELPLSCFHPLPLCLLGTRITQRAVPKGEHGSVLYPTMAAIRCCAKQIALSAKHRAKQASAAACEGARNGGGACRRPNSLEKTSSPFLRRKDMRSPICGIFPGDWAYHEPTWPGMGFFLPFPGG